MLDDVFFVQHQELRDVVRDMLTRSLVGLSERDGPAAHSAAAAELMTHLRQIGVPGLGIDEVHGGAGGGIIEQVVVARELGRSLAPCSFVASAMTTALWTGTEDATSTKLLGALASGQRVAVAVPQPDWAPWGHPATGLRHEQIDERNAMVSGQLTGVIDADEAAILVIAPRPAAGDTPSIMVAEPRHGGVHVESTNQTGVIRSFSTVSLDSAPATIHRVSSHRLANATSDGRLLLSYEMLGACEAVIESASRYAATREQFGSPIGTFQAVSHRLAAVYIELQAAAAAASFALRAYGGADYPLAAKIARELVARCLSASCEAALQVFGAIGFTWEFSLHHYLKYAKTCERFLATERHIEAEIVQSQGS